MKAAKEALWGHFRLFLLASLSLIVILAFLSFSGCSEKRTEPPKKTYALTVTLSDGVEGHPQAGTQICEPGGEIDYAYQTLEDYSNLAVTLDGTSVLSSGSFTMNADHELAATCLKRVLWKYYVDQAVYYSCPAIGDDGTIYFGTGMFIGPPYNEWRPGTIYAFSPDGVLKWSNYIGNALFSPVIGSDGTIYIQDHRNNVYALTPAGTVKWIYSDYDFEFHRDMGQRNPAIGADGTIYIGVDGLYAVNPLNGKRIWHVAHTKYPTKECIASPVIGHNGTIYVVIGQDQLHAISPSGSRRWVFSFAHEWDMSFATPAIDQNGVVYLGVEGYSGYTPYSHIYAINPNGTQRWKYRVDGGRFVRGSAAIGPDGTIYIATKAGGTELTAKLVALSPTGQKLWDYELERTQADSYSSPSVGADGLIYFGAETGIFYVLNPDGTLNWKHQLRYGINWSSPAIADDGTVYIGTIDGDDYQGFFYALQSTSMGYASTPWPRFRHDRKNTGRSGAQ